MPMSGIKYILLGIAALVLGQYGGWKIGSYTIYLPDFCVPLGVLFCVIGLVKGDKPRKNAPKENSVPHSEDSTDPSAEHGQKPL